MRQVAEFIAVISCALFTGAAVYLPTPVVGNASVRCEKQGCSPHFQMVCRYHFVMAGLWVVVSKVLAAFPWNNS